MWSYLSESILFQYCHSDSWFVNSHLLIASFIETWSGYWTFYLTWYFWINSLNFLRVLSGCRSRLKYSFELISNLTKCYCLMSVVLYWYLVWSLLPNMITKIDSNRGLIKIIVERGFLSPLFYEDPPPPLPLATLTTLSFSDFVWPSLHPQLFFLPSFLDWTHDCCTTSDMLFFT